MRLIPAAAVALLLCLPAAAHAAEETAPATAPADDDAQAEKPKKVCRMETTTGSVMPKRVCRTPEQVAEKVRAYIDLGCTYFVPWCSDYPDDTTLRLFADKVIPEFR